MRKLLLILLIPIIYYSCKKSDIAPQNNSSKTIIETAKKFFEDNVATANSSSADNPRLQTTKIPDWQNAYTRQLPIGISVIVPIHYALPLRIRTNFSGQRDFSLDSLTQLLIYQDTNKVFHAQVLTTFPDSIYLNGHSGYFQGYIYVDEWNGNPIFKFRYSAEGLGIYSQLNANDYSTPKTETLSQAVQICSQVSGYNYSPDNPNDGVSWSEDPVCNTYFLPVHVGSVIYSFGNAIGILPPGGGAIPTVPPPSTAITLGSNPIANIKTYMGCFTNIAGNSNSYTVTLCVDQPIPGTRSAWGFLSSPSQSSAAGNLIDPGHTFLIFTQTSGSYIIRRSVGFYPTGVVFPGNTQKKGILNDDEFHGYDISMTFNVDNSQFFQILNAAEIGNDPFFMYDLNTMNCSTYAIDALQAGGFYLPCTIGSWPGGSGYDPGDLGEDIRGFTLSANESRSTTESFHQNTGTCQ